MLPACSRIVRLHGLVGRPACQRFLSVSRTLQQNKEGDKTTLDKDEIKRLSEDLTKEFEQSTKDGTAEKQMEEKIDPNFMNFRQMNERQAHDRSGSIFTWKFVAGIGVTAGSLLLALLWLKKQRLDEAERMRKATAGKARIGGEWELVNTDGKLEGSKDFRGTWLLLYFGFTHCPDICPDEIEKMIKVVDLLERDKDPIAIKPLFISVDPARDTIPRVKEYCAEFSPKLRGFTGSQEQVNAVAKTFRVYHSEGPKTAPDDYIVDHTVIMYLIDPEGNFFDYYGQNRKAEEIAQTIRLKVLKEETAKKRAKSLF